MLAIISKPKPVTKVLIASDIHWSHRDRASWELFEAFRRGYKPDILVSLGDTVEFATVGSYANFDYGPEGNLVANSEEDLEEECFGVRRMFARWREEHPQARIIHCDGNHEARLGKFLVSSAHPIAGLKALSIPHLWELQEQKIEWHRYRAWVDLPFGKGIRLTHGTKASQTPAKGEYMEHRFAGVGISGHVHRYDQYNWGDGTGWISTPALCKTAVNWRGPTQWANGWTIVEHEPINNTVNIETITVRDKSYFLWRGYEGRIKPETNPPAP